MQHTRREIVYSVRMFCSELAKEESAYRTIWQRACASTDDYSLEYLITYSLGYLDGQVAARPNESDAVVAKALLLITQCFHGTPGAFERLEELRLGYIESRTKRKADEEEAKQKAMQARKSDVKFN